MSSIEISKTKKETFKLKIELTFDEFIALKQAIEENNATICLGVHDLMTDAIVKINI